MNSRILKQKQLPLEMNSYNPQNFNPFSIYPFLLSNHLMIRQTVLEIDSGDFKMNQLTEKPYSGIRIHKLVLFTLSFYSFSSLLLPGALSTCGFFAGEKEINLLSSLSKIFYNLTYYGFNIPFFCIFFLLFLT